MGNTTIEIETLKQHIQHAAGQLEQQPDPSGDDGIGSLIYLGNHHDAVPRDLVLDPILESGEIHTWMLMKIHVDNPMLATRIPSQNSLITQLKCSRPIVSRHMQVLRALRWLTLCAEVRGSDGQFRGVVYAQHDQPLSLADTLQLDSGYIDFLEQPTKGDVLKRLRNIKHSVLTHTDYLVFQDHHHLSTPPTRLEQIDARLKSHTSGDPLDTHLSCPADAVDPDGVKNLYGDPEKPAHSKHLKKTLGHRVKNIDTVEMEKNDGILAKSPCKKLLHGDSFPSSSSGLNNKKTTTTPPPPPKQQLRFPKAVSKSKRQTAYAMKIIEPLPETDQQFVLDWLADKIRAGENGTDRPVGNAIRYLAWIVKHKKAGTLPESDYGLGRTATTKTLTTNTHSEDREENQRRWEATMKKLGKSIKPDGTATRDKQNVR